MIDPAARIHADAVLAPDVQVGPWSSIGAGVEIGAGVVIASHVVIKGPCRIGRDTRIFQFCSIGEDPADTKYRGEETQLVIGAGNIIREGVTLHRGTSQGGGTTRIGDHNLIMAYVHVGHDSVVGSHVTLVNNAALAGHVVVCDHVTLGGYVLVHQRCYIGAHAYVGMGSAVRQDIPPYVLANGTPARPHGINLVGLRRRNFGGAAIRAIKEAYQLLYNRGLLLRDARRALEPLARRHEEVRLLCASLEHCTRGIVR